MLDGAEITLEERYTDLESQDYIIAEVHCPPFLCRQSSQTLFPPEKPYPFSLGEHHVLVHYLSSIYPMASHHGLVKPFLNLIYM